MTTTNAGNANPTLAYAALIASLLFGVAGQLLMKYAAINSVGHSIASGNLVLTAAALFVYGLGVICWIVALRGVRLSIAYPLSSLNYVGIFIGSYYLFGEDITPQRLLGVALIFGGVLLIVLRNQTVAKSS